jgi:hypothetical protein
MSLPLMALCLQGTRLFLYLVAEYNMEWMYNNRIHTKLG